MLWNNKVKAVFRDLMRTLAWGNHHAGECVMWLERELDEAAKPCRVVETMWRGEIRDTTIRVWRTETDCPHMGNMDIIRALEVLPRSWFVTPTDTDLKAIAAAVEALPRVNAVEVLRDDGSGFVIYPEWP